MQGKGARVQGRTATTAFSLGVVTAVPRDKARQDAGLARMRPRLVHGVRRVHDVGREYDEVGACGCGAYTRAGQGLDKWAYYHRFPLAAARPREAPARDPAPTGGGGVDAGKGGSGPALDGGGFEPDEALG
jgi:hypothetical protein